MLHVIVTLVVMVAAIWAIIKKIKPQTVLVLAGFVLLLYSYFMGLKADFLAPKIGFKTSTGSPITDMFAYIRWTLSKDISSLGLTIMCGAGFAKYMDVIGASSRMVDIMMKPLRKLNAPYVVTALGFTTCMALSLAIQSASALSTLTMVTIYPILRGLGASPLAAASVIASGHLLDIGPAAATSAVVAENVLMPDGKTKMTLTQLFVEHQLPVYIWCGIFATVSHYFWQKYLDKKEGYVVAQLSEQELAELSKSQNAQAMGPIWYVFLPCLPLFFIILFSEYGLKTIKVDIVTAMLMSLFIAMVCEFIRHKYDFKKVAASIQNFFDGMGKMFAVTVTLIVAAKVFAFGITSTGAVSMFTEAIKSSGLGATIVTFIVSTVIVILSVATGSGVAIMYSFAPIIPDFAAGIHGDPLTMLHAMQNAASLGRLLSPVAAVMVLVAGMAGVNPVDLVKRNSVPVLVSIVVSMVTVIFFYR